MYYSNIKIINKKGNPINRSGELFVIIVMWYQYLSTTVTDLGNILQLVA
jgi:hypothetical protein